MKSNSKAWGSRLFCLIALATSYYGLSVTFNLSSDTIGFQYIATFFILGIVLCLMMMVGSGTFSTASSDGQSPHYEALRYSAVLSHAFSWIYIPVSAAIATFYLTSQTPYYSIRYYISSNSDLTFFTILFLILSIGMDHIDMSLVNNFFPITMLIACILYQNYFGVLAAILNIIRIVFLKVTFLDILRPQSSQFHNQRVLFLQCYSAMVLSCLTCATLILMTDMEPTSIFSIWNSLAKNIQKIP